jgi:von Willebrand factor type A domain/Abnormal spindle-like microcephaly-assoc'd, ASPM-SPD-2-Hydin
MACTPLSIQTGFFINTQPWDNSPNNTFGGKTLTLNTAGLTVQQGAHSVFHSRGLNHNILYMILGGQFLVILDMPTDPGPQTRFLNLVDFSTWTETNILMVSADSTVPPPVVNPSMGNGCVFMAFGQDGTQQTALAIYRSDNGGVLCSVGSIVPTGQTLGEATATQLIIHFNTGNTNHTQVAALPAGVCTVTSPQPQDFGTLHVGGCPFTPVTKQFTLKNTGNDCLAINSITNSPPFTVQSTVPALPATLTANQTVTVTAEFNPTAVGSWNPANLVVNASDGTHNLACKGQAVAAVFSIQFNATSHNFGKLPVGQAAPAWNLVITNNGSQPNNVNVPALNANGFTCTAWAGNLNCGQSQNIPIAFTPQAVGLQTATLSIVSQAPGSPHAISLSGTGCLAQAVIGVPPTNPIDLGQVQQGFRTVQFFLVQNTGEGPLQFQGALSGPDAALFGLPDPNGSVTNAPQAQSYSADPVSPCGNLTAGNGQAVVAVSFFANGTPNAMPKSATLTLSNANAVNATPGQTWVFPLSATIVPGVALDVALVVDHSGSMSDSLGSRVKMDAAVSASELFVELLRPDLDDRTAIVRFNQLPEIVVPMTPVTTTTAPTQAQIRAQVDTGLPPPGGNTAIAGGALTGIREVQKPRTTTPPLLTKAVIVLTDGEENTAFEDPPNSGNWISIQDSTTMVKPIPQTGTVTSTHLTKPSDITIYTIGIGKDSDIDMNQLNALATQAPQDVFRVNQDLTGTQYFSLEKYYTQIFMDVVGTSPISDPMYWIFPGQTQQIQFEVLRGDVDALIVIYDYQGMRLPFWCLSPLGEIVDASIVPPGFQLRSGFASEARFLEFKMPPNQPNRYAGTWTVVIQHQGRVCFGTPQSKPHTDTSTIGKHTTTATASTHSVVTTKIPPGFLPRECKPTKDPVLYGIAIGVGSNFRMQPYVQPGAVYVGDPILLTAVITEAGLPVIGCQVTVTATSPTNDVWTMKLFDDGAHSDGGPSDGEYADNFTHAYEAGTYHFVFHATGYSRDGQPVVREAMRDKVVQEKPSTTGGGDNGGGDKDCCDKLLRAIDHQTKLLEQLLKKR